MLLKRIVRLVCLLLAFTVSATAQVTTSSITGTVKSSSGEVLDGATVTATHEPSGTQYTTISRKGGTFNMPGLRVGGPYTVKIEFVGFKPMVYEGIQLTLGDAYNINSTMGENIAEIAEVVVTASRRKISQDKTGASTNIGSRQITTLPTISRSLSDFTRLTPQANGNSFGGRDNRFNNIQVDGANLNNNFGLSSDPLPGGGNQPISLDAFEEVSVNIAPYDVRQAGFTGAGINAVTKSGTNTFRGTVYHYLRNESFNGKRVGDTKLGPQQAQDNKIYGGALGGPIIKNKLFFFVNGEYEQRTFPGIQWSPAGGSGIGNVSTISADTLARFSNHLRNTYGYETGPYDNFKNFQAENYKILAKIDWNINNVHKLTAKYNELSSTNDVALNAFSTPNGALTGLQARFGLNGMSYENSNYAFEDKVRSATLELNSTKRGRWSNQLLATYTKISAVRTTNSALFPFIDIRNANGPNTAANISAGLEPFSNNNQVVNDVYGITNNFTYYAGKHTITAGASYEYQNVGNMFMPGSQSYYAFNSLDDFINNRAPIIYSNTYSLVPGKDAVFASELKIGQLGLYLQDEINISPVFKLTAGIRFDRPIYGDEPIENPAITALQLYDKNGNLTNYKNNVWPKSTFYVSPRVGFRWDVEGDKSLIVRGGTGVFTGRIPFVWLTNIPSNSGMYQFGAIVRDAAQLENFKFNPDPAFHLDKLPQQAGQSVPGNIVVTDPNFKFPQIFRTNLAFDKSFGNGWVLTMEAIYTKDINAVRMRNANERPTNGTINGADDRPRFLTAADRRLNSNITGSAIVLENTNEGNSFAFTTQISKTFTKGLYGSLAYTYSFANDVTPNPGSTANSVWNGNAAIGTQNSVELYGSQYALPHRVVGNISYRAEYFKKNLATTISLFYEGAHQGTFTYAVSGDLNNDGNSNVDLLYIPRNPSEINFVNIVSGGQVTFTAQQQSDAFFNYIEQDDYLKKRKGTYAERSGALLPWYNRVDFKILQDLSKKIGNNKNTLQLSVDIFNFANMISKNAGIRNLVNQNLPIQFAGYNGAGQPTYRMQTLNGQLLNSTFRRNVSTASTWSMQIGIRYIFN
jgi:outer membrane receptor protein involved in Fe transport